MELERCSGGKCFFDKARWSKFQYVVNMTSCEVHLYNFNGLGVNEFDEVCKNVIEDAEWAYLHDADLSYMSQQEIQS